MNNKVIAIDGPAGAGKSTIAKKLATAMGFEYIDTGAMYRAATLKLLLKAIDLENQSACVQMIRETDISFEDRHILLDGVVVDDEIRTDKVNRAVSIVSAMKEIRTQLVETQRNIAKNKNVILDGRDIGTVVFPNADYKFYLDASIEERAKRRYKEQREKGFFNVNYHEIVNSIANRDRIDSQREASPLQQAEDAIYLDTSHLSIDEVVERLGKVIALEIIVDENAGFCFGVRNAVNTAYHLAEESDTEIYTYGALIHNEQVIEDMRAHGIITLEDTETENAVNKKILIRAHGVPETEQKALEHTFQEVVDCTCPNVKQIHKIVRNAWEHGLRVVIVGDAVHPEVKGINGWCNFEGIIINDEKTVDKLPDYDKICIVAQTTITNALWENVVQALKSKCNEMEIHNTICGATRKRQSSTVALAQRMEVMFVVGSKKSSNTNKLYALSRQNNENTFFIETAKEILPVMIEGKTHIGITAGASTPDWIIKEVIKKMEELQMGHDSDLYAQYENTFKELEMGQIIKGKVIQITEDEIIVDVQYKTDGIIKKDDYSWDKNVDLKAEVQLGDEIEAEVYRIKESEGVYLSVKSIAARKNWNALKEVFDNHETVEGTITSIVKGGGIVEINGIRAFMPASHFDLRYAEDLTPYLNQNVTVNIIDYVPEKKKVVVSRKEQLKKEQEEKEKKVWETIHVGDKVEGEVKRLTTFGAFVDLGGIDGLIYITELSWARVKHPSDVLKPGDKVEVLVLAADPETKKISLSLKATLPNPWDVVAEKYNKGDIVEVKVLRFADFGAFVQIEPGVDGLVHISQISKKRVNKVADELSIGQVVKAKILEILPESKKISLSIKAAIAEEEAAEQAEQVKAYEESNSAEEAETTEE